MTNDEDIAEIDALLKNNLSPGQRALLKQRLNALEDSMTFVLNQATNSCCGQPAGQCTCKTIANPFTPGYSPDVTNDDDGAVICNHGPLSGHDQPTLIPKDGPRPLGGALGLPQPMFD
jgi:hypothetical protein